MSAVGLFVTCAVGAAQTSNRRVHFEGKVASGQTLVVEGARGSKPVFTLPAWVAPDEFSVSPSGRHALVYAKLKKGEARTAILFDVADPATAKETGRFKPGVGGSWYWSPTDTVILVAGCGTSCAQILVHDLAGKELAGLLCDGFDSDSELSNDHRFVACFSTSPSPRRGELQVVDTTDGRVVRQTHLPCMSNGGVNRDAVSFEKSGGGMSFQCYDATKKRNVGVVVAWTAGRPALTSTELPKRE